jgi:hypothetical protein
MRNFKDIFKNQLNEKSMYEMDRYITSIIAKIEKLLYVFENKYKDTRPREALKAAKKFSDDTGNYGAEIETSKAYHEDNNAFLVANAAKNIAYAVERFIHDDMKKSEEYANVALELINNVRLKKSLNENEPFPIKWDNGLSPQSLFGAHKPEIGFDKFGNRWEKQNDTIDHSGKTKVYVTLITKNSNKRFSDNGYNFEDTVKKIWDRAKNEKNN